MSILNKEDKMKELEAAVAYKIALTQHELQTGK
jgi:hypothetical protein